MAGEPGEEQNKQRTAWYTKFPPHIAEIISGVKFFEVNAIVHYHGFKISQVVFSSLLVGGRHGDIKRRTPGKESFTHDPYPSFQRTLVRMKRPAMHCIDHRQPQ